MSDKSYIIDWFINSYLSSLQATIVKEFLVCSRVYDSEVTKSQRNRAPQRRLQIFKEAEKWSFKSKICKPKISSFVIKKAITSLGLNIFQ